MFGIFRYLKKKIGRASMMSKPPEVGAKG